MPFPFLSCFSERFGPDETNKIGFCPEDKPEADSYRSFYYFLSFPPSQLAETSIFVMTSFPQGWEYASNSNNDGLPLSSTPVQQTVLINPLGG